MGIKLFRAGILAHVALFGLAPALAQDKPLTAAANADPASADSGIAEIIVTAQRRTETAQKAGIAISVIAPDALSQVTQPSELTKLAPSLQIGSGAGATSVFYVRGVGSYAANPYTDSGVAVNYDGVYLGRPTSTIGLFYDLERIEVLKGPQGTLYGRNATGGAINILPNKPKIGVSSMDLILSAGNYEAANGQVAVNLPISDQLAVRFAGTAYTRDGYLSDGTYDDRGAGGRLQLLYQPSETFSARISADYFHVGGSGGAGTLYGFWNAGTRTVRPALPLSTGLFDPRAIALFNSPAALFAPAGVPLGPLSERPSRDNDHYGINAEITADLGFATLTFLPAYRQSKLRIVHTSAAFLVNNFQKDHQFSSELRLDGSAGPIDWLVGGYYFDEKVDGINGVSARVTGSAQVLVARNKSYAGFGRLTANLTDSVRLTAAGRYTQDKRRFNGQAEGPLAQCPTRPVPCTNFRPLPAYFDSAADAFRQIGYVFQPGNNNIGIDASGQTAIIYRVTRIPVNERLSQGKFTYRLAAEYDLAPQSMAYASFETGYRSGGFSFSTVRPTFDPETIDAYTLGVKNRFFGNRLQFNVEAFLWKYKDQQLSHSATGIGGIQEFVTENIGSSTNKGIEVEMIARPWPNTTLRGDAQYLDTNLDSFSYIEPDASAGAGLPGGTVRPVTTCAIAYNGPARSNYTVDCSGLRALRSPKWTINLGVDQVVPLSPAYQIDLSFNTHYQSASQQMFERLPIGIQQAHWISDASAGLSDPEGAWSIAAYVNNIENRRVLGALNYFAAGNVISAVSGTPRTYGLRGRVSF